MLAQIIKVHFSDVGRGSIACLHARSLIGIGLRPLVRVQRRTSLAQTRQATQRDYPPPSTVLTPSPLAKEHRSLFGALPFRRISKNFLLTKSPPSTSTRSSLSLGASLRTSGLSGTTTSTVPSFHTARTSLGRPSFKSRESDVSVGNYGSSGHASTSSNSRAAYMRKNLL